MPSRKPEQPLARSPEYWRWRRNRPEGRLQRRKEHAARKERARALVRDYLQSHGCADCGESDWTVLEFDHLRDKIKGISDLITGGATARRILAEIAKCDVVCKNDHARRTYSRQGGYRSGPIGRKAAEAA